MTTTFHLLLRTALGLLLVASFSPAVHAEDSFLQSDDYEEGGKVIGMFLVDDDYARMVEDIERNDTSFDWGWAATPGLDEPAAPRGGKLKQLFQRRGPRLVQEPRQLDFDLRAFRTIYIPPVQNFAGIMAPELLAQIRDSFVEAAKMFSLEAVADRQSADLELGVASIDQMRSTANVPVYGIRVDPFVELELRLTDVKADRDLLLIRNRKHGGSVAEAAFNFADDFVKFLR
ncbi:MAG: hypothetical protein F9K18_02595 [Thermoanaerobaculia bacterium]|nr:MAG: hypothetical protein F9K18_02595 [Thermoanaerobaculia bacterium]